MKTYYEDEGYTENGEKTVMIFDADTNQPVPDDIQFEIGDELLLLNMPFDRDGRHATGVAVFDGYDTLSNGFRYPQWRLVYEGD